MSMHDQKTNGFINVMTPFSSPRIFPRENWHLPFLVETVSTLSTVLGFVPVEAAGAVTAAGPLPSLRLRTNCREARHSKYGTESDFQVKYSNDTRYSTYELI